MSSDRNVLKLQFGALFDEVSAALFAADPVGINFGDNTDEYDPQTGTILPRLRGAHSADDVQVLVYEEFCRWFGKALPLLGPPEGTRRPLGRDQEGGPRRADRGGVAGDWPGGLIVGVLYNVIVSGC